MTPLVLLLVLVGLAVGAAFAFGTPILAIPLVFVVLAGWAGVAFVRRARGRGPVPESEQEIEFDEEDRRTLAPEPSAQEKADNRRRATRSGSA
jgi:uncharacterized membrane protein